MAYTAATAAILKAAFPAFAAVADGTIDYWIARAQRSVDASWLEDDRQMGEMLLASHHMELLGLGTGTAAELAAQGMGDFKSIRSGSLSLDRSAAGSEAAHGTMRSTQYGRQWMDLAKLNKGGARVTGTGYLPTSPLYPDGA